MLDLQAVFVRDLAKLHSIDFVTMVKIRDEDLTGLVEVAVNGHQVKFIATAGGTLYAALPSGLVFEQISSVRLVRSIVVGESTVVGTDMVSPSKVSADSGLLVVKGEDFTKTTSVRVNKVRVDFVVIDPGTLYCELPADAKYLDTVEVISSSRTVSRETFFEYMLGDSPTTTSGPAKMTFQFVKLLMTTPGTDIFNKNMGGNLQHWVGQTVDLKNPYALIAKTVLSITTLGANVAGSQLASRLPPEERLASVQVADIGFSEANPDTMHISLRLVSAAQQVSLVSLLVGSLEDVPSTLAGV